MTHLGPALCRVVVAVTLLLAPRAHGASIDDDAIEVGAEVQMDLDEVLDRLATAQRRISSFLVEYRVNYDGASELPGAYLHRTVAMKGPSSIYHDNAHGHAQLQWQDDPLRWACYVTSDEYAAVRINSATFTSERIAPSDPPVGSLPDEWVLWATGLWPLDTRPAPRIFGKHPYFLKYYAADEALKRLRSRLERVDGAWCHVVERPGIDVVWLDLDRGATLVAREILDQETRQPVRRFVLMNHQEVEPGIWMPGRILDVRFDEVPADGNSSPSSRRSTAFEILHWQINDVPDEAFVYDIQPGALQIDAPAGTRAQVDSDTVMHLDNVSRVAMAVRKRHIDQHLPHRRLFAAGMLALVTFETIIRIRPGKGRG
jgi:hypothetical protein